MEYFGLADPAPRVLQCQGMKVNSVLARQPPGNWANGRLPHPTGRGDGWGRVRGGFEGGAVSGTRARTWFMDAVGETGASDMRDRSANWNRRACGRKNREDAIKEIIGMYAQGRVRNEDRWYNLKWMEQVVTK